VTVLHFYISDCDINTNIAFIKLLFVNNCYLTYSENVCEEMQNTSSVMYSNCLTTRGSFETTAPPRVMVNEKKCRQYKRYCDGLGEDVIFEIKINLEKTEARATFRILEFWPGSASLSVILPRIFVAIFVLVATKIPLRRCTRNESNKQILHVYL